MVQDELISVIIPTFNRGRLVGRAIRSVLAQTYPRVQIIVVDDGSTDNTAVVVQAFPEITYVWQPNRGQAAARNAGLARAQGSLIATLDSDDTWEPDFLSVCAWKLVSEDLDFVFANWCQDDGRGGWRDFMRPNPYMKPFWKRQKKGWVLLDDPSELRDLYLRACPSPSSSALIRRAVMLAGWNEEIHIGDDWCLYLDIILNNPCRTAFTYRRLWNKGFERTSVFEGCDRATLLRFLYIEDFQRFMQRFQKLLSAAELRLLEVKYMESLVELAKYQMIHHYDVRQSLWLLRRSMERNLFFTLKTIPKVMVAGLRHRLHYAVRALGAGHGRSFVIES